MKDKISIIMPVYNSEKYLNKSIQSVLTQSYTEWELIIINDGSTDNSINICREYSESDERIKVVTTENLGVSRARNRGIKEASGDFILFLDSDDTISKNCLRNSVDHISKSNADICIFGFAIVCGEVETKRVSPMYSEEIVKESFVKKHLCYFFEQSLLHCVGNKLYRKSLLNKSYYKEEWNYHEDIMFALESIVNAQKIVIMTEVYYSYNYVEESLSHKVMPGRYDAAIEVYNYVQEHILSNTEMLDFEKVMNDFLLYNLLGELKELTLIYKSDRVAWLQNVKKLNDSRFLAGKIRNSRIRNLKKVVVLCLFKMHMYEMLYIICVAGTGKNEK